MGKEKKIKKTRKEKRSENEKRTDRREENKHTRRGAEERRKEIKRRKTSPLHHLLVSSSSTALPDVQGIVGQRVLGLIIVVGSQQRAGPDAHVVGRQRPTEL